MSHRTLLCLGVPAGLPRTISTRALDGLLMGWSTRAHANYELLLGEARGANAESPMGLHVTTCTSPPFHLTCQCHWPNQLGARRNVLPCLITGLATLLPLPWAYQVPPCTPLVSHGLWQRLVVHRLICQFFHGLLARKTPGRRIRASCLESGQTLDRPDCFICGR